MVKAGDYSFVIADIPGLIEGAHEGHGLGDRFLGHVERTSVLLHLIDATQDDVVLAYKTIQNELKQYGGGLAKKPQIIALTKMDAIGEELALDQARILEEATGQKPLVISSVSYSNIDSVLYKLADIIKANRNP